MVDVNIVVLFRSRRLASGLVHHVDRIVRELRDGWWSKSEDSGFLGDLCARWDKKS